jgi:hypothetical protein
MNANNIIAQHRNSVALSFSNWGYNGMAVNADTLEAMTVLYGNAYLQHLQHLVQYERQFVGYTSDVIETPVSATDIYDYATGGIRQKVTEDYNIGTDMGMIKDPYMSDDVAYTPPIWLPPPPPQKEDLGVVTNPTLPVVDIKALPTKTMPSTGISAMDIYNGDIPDSLPIDTMQAMQSGEPQVFAASSTNKEMEKSFWEKNKTLILIVIGFFAIIMLSRKSSPIIIK